VPGGRALRADARENEDRLLAAAARAFARDGAEASLKAIAADAGVGIGTLYRRFATREALVEAVYRSETARLCGSAPELLTREPPGAALRAWMEAFVDYTTTKHGMADALPTILAAHAGLRTQTRDLLEQAVAALLAAGIAGGEFRDDVPAADVLMGLGGVTLIAGHEAERALASRLISLLLDALRPPG
jgi:AcrR family transcriptional regulator